MTRREIPVCCNVTLVSVISWSLFVSYSVYLCATLLKTHVKTQRYDISLPFCVSGLCRLDVSCTSATPKPFKLRGPSTLFVFNLYAA